MKKNESGILSVEASLVLCAFTLFVLFLFNFSAVYRAENMVSHATLQAADAVALESYLRETSFETDTQRVLFWANRMNGAATISEESLESLRTADLPTLAKEKFTLAVEENAAEAGSVLKKLGIENGLNGMDFSGSYVDLKSNDVIIQAKYNLKLKFPVFGATELQLTKAAKAKTAGSILFGIKVLPQEQVMGVTTGTGKYSYGTEVQISAEENYGYGFVSWDDGSTENPRKITVTEAKTYIAQFKRHNFGVNLFIEDSTAADGRVKGSNTYGTVSAVFGGAVSVGGNEYSYGSTVTVKAEEKPGYRFQYWKGSKIGDTATEPIYKEQAQFSVPINGTYDLTAVYKPIEYTLAVTTNCSAAKNSIGIREFGTTEYFKKIAASYGNAVELRAANIDGYDFEGWYLGSKCVSEYIYVKLPVPVGNQTFEAKYEKRPVLTVQANGSGSAKIAANGKTVYRCRKGSTVKVEAVPNEGYCFAGWSDGGEAFHWVCVNADTTLTATFKPLYTVQVLSDEGGSASGGGKNLPADKTTDIKASPNTGYHFVKWQKSTDDGNSFYDVSNSANYSPVVDGNAIYKAIFEKNSYQVTLKPNGGSLKSVKTVTTVKHGESSVALPKPVRQGYRFKGWKLGGQTYSTNSKVTNITKNIELVAQWSKCTKHTWGRCGVTHTATKAMYLSEHSKRHKTGKYQCMLCTDCGVFYNGTCPKNCINSGLDRSKIGAAHLCYQTSGCANMWNKKKVYNIHKELGYPED